MLREQKRIDRELLRGGKKVFVIYFRSVWKHVEIFLGGCLRNNTQYPRFEITACRQPENMVSIETRTEEIFKKSIKCAERKRQWKMYSPSGSKSFQLKRNRACGGGGGLLGVQACVHRGSASLFALRRWASHVTPAGRSFWISRRVFRILFDFLILFCSPCSDTSEPPWLFREPCRSCRPSCSEARRITSRYRRQRDDEAPHESPSRKERTRQERHLIRLPPALGLLCLHFCDCKNKCSLRKNCCSTTLLRGI